ncbi:MAG: hypothetical protein HYU37_04975 [Acidobacteria bacterium]|nr:hypothetical protein [Acidobacteriota bacterium]
MRLFPLMAALLLVLTISGSAAAQDWIEYENRDDLFGVNLPGEPEVEVTTYTSEFGAVLPARIYRAEEGRSRYSVTVVDYRGIRRILTEKAASCPAGAQTCAGGGEAGSGTGNWRMDHAGALVYASWRLLQRPGTEATHYNLFFSDLVLGHQLQLANADGSRTFVSILMHQDRLYIFEGTRPGELSPPLHFQLSVRFLDANGNHIRYRELYCNICPVPPLSR